MSESAVDPTYPSTDLDLDLRWWAAANYLTIGQIYLKDNALLRDPLVLDHVKPRLLGHWGTSPGLSMIYALLNRVIRERDGRLALRHRSGARRACTGRGRVAGGHLHRGLPARHGRRRGHPHAVPPVLVAGRGAQPRQRADAGEHPRGWRARLRAGPRGRRGVRPPRPRRRLRRRRRRGGDRPAGGVVAAADLPQPSPRRGGAADPAPQRLQDRRAHGARPHQRRGRGGLPAQPGLGPGDGRRRRPATRCSRRCWPRCARAHDSIRSIQAHARRGDGPSAAVRHQWPAVVLRTPKGWTGPDVVDGIQVEGTNLSHQVPLSGLAENPEHLRMLEEWLRSYDPGSLFDDDGRLAPELRGAWRPRATAGCPPRPTPTAGGCARTYRCRRSTATPWRSTRQGSPWWRTP